MYSVILPVFNEISVLQNCLESLRKQTVCSQMEVIVIDDGSTDSTLSEIRSRNQRDEIRNLVLLEQNHQGPGAARNLGASKATGEILVFLDADMEFEPDFIEKLTELIIKKQTIGTFSKDEYLLNKDNIWARLWNINLGREESRMIGREEYPNGSPVFRAILKSKFDQSGGFDENVGYTDDWSLSRKLGILATLAPGAKYYHRNPETLFEVWTQARWFGKNEFLTKNFIRKVFNLFRYCPILAVFKIYDLNFLVFKFIYNLAVCTSVLLSFFREKKNK